MECTVRTLTTNEIIMSIAIFSGFISFIVFFCYGKYVSKSKKQSVMKTTKKIKEVLKVLTKISSVLFITSLICLFFPKTHDLTINIFLGNIIAYLIIIMLRLIVFGLSITDNDINEEKNEIKYDDTVERLERINIILVKR